VDTRKLKLAGRIPFFNDNNISIAKVILRKLEIQDSKAIPKTIVFSGKVFQETDEHTFKSLPVKLAIKDPGIFTLAKNPGPDNLDIGTKPKQVKFTFATAQGRLTFVLDDISIARDPDTGELMIGEITRSNISNIILRFKDLATGTERKIEGLPKVDSDDRSGYRLAAAMAEGDEVYPAFPTYSEYLADMYLDNPLQFFSDAYTLFWRDFTSF